MDGGCSLERAGVEAERGSVTTLPSSLSFLRQLYSNYHFTLARSVFPSLSRSHSQDLLFSRVTSTDLAVDFTKSDNPDAAIACRAPPHPSHTLHSSQSSVHVLEASFTRQAESSPFRGTPEVYTYTPSFSDTFTVKQGSDLILFHEERYSLLVSTHYSYTTLTTRPV